MSKAEILAELDRLIGEAQAEERPALVVELAARVASLGAGLTATTRIVLPQREHEEKRLLTAQEAAALAGVTPRWLLRHTRGLRFRHDLSRKQARFEEGSFRRWLLVRA